MNKMFLRPEETGRYKEQGGTKNMSLSDSSKILLWRSVQTNGWPFLDADLDNSRSGDGKVMLKIHPTLQSFLDFDR